jgi:DNA-binding response OmpR family regulator
MTTNSPSKDADDPSATVQKRGHILIIDDDREISQSLSYALSARDFNVSVAYDGNRGLAIAETQAPDLVILDMMMPKRSGFLVLERIRQASTVPCPVIMITGNEGQRHREYAELLGVADYILKPFTLDHLLKRVDELLES